MIVAIFYFRMGPEFDVKEKAWKRQLFGEANEALST